jgi:predicted nucleic acid-binding protein
VLLYLDVCCLNRPFDDQTQARIHMEAEAVLEIIRRVDSGAHELCDSAALRAENSQNPSEHRRQYVEGALDQARTRVPHEARLDQRVAELCDRGFRPMDAYHVACAEIGACDRLVTCDDQFLRVARRSPGIIRVMVTDPVSLSEEPGF